MPGDPHINEGACIFMLQQEINQETLPYHQDAALHVVMDLYDRKVTREEFGKNAGVAISFYAALSKLFVIEQTRIMMLRVGEPLTLEEVDKSSAMLTSIAKDKATLLVKCMTLLAECPTTQDPVH